MHLLLPYTFSHSNVFAHLCSISLTPYQIRPVPCATSLSSACDFSSKTAGAKPGWGMGTEGKPDYHTPTLPGEERHWAKGDRQPVGVGSVSAGVGGWECHTRRRLSWKLKGKMLLLWREGRGSHLGLRCCCLESWWVQALSQLLLGLQGALKPSFIFNMEGRAHTTSTAFDKVFILPSPGYQEWTV